jgi:hypothetical protein
VGGGGRGQSTDDEQRLVGAARRWWSRLDHRRWAGPDRRLPEMEEERERLGGGRCRNKETPRKKGEHNLPITGLGGMIGGPFLIHWCN